ncbi:MAG TPA: hypothetical protein EYQ14_25835 [Gammaproteobacteria bacterium]|nr:hypothetical protein [Gammaproteobacteria bacterium]
MDYSKIEKFDKKEETNMIAREINVPMNGDYNWPDAMGLEVQSPTLSSPEDILIRREELGDFSLLTNRNISNAK